MGRKDRQLCCQMKLMVAVGVLIIFLPSWLFAPETYRELARFFMRRTGWKGGQAADVLFVNATIWTGDVRQPWAHSMAVANGRILSLGDSPEVLAIGRDTKIVDLEGKFVTPGFIDSHTHFISGGLQMDYVQLETVTSRADFTNRLKLATESVEKGKWIIGVNWNHESWGGELPEASWIDAPNHPVVACRVDGHMCVANSFALALADIHRGTVNPEGGTIVRDHKGDPTGALVDTALTRVVKCIPQPSVEERRSAYQKASELALSNGVTSVVDFGRITPGGPPEQPWDDLNDVYLWADSTGHMKVRVTAYYPLQIWSTVAAFVKQRGHDVSQWLRVGGVKAFADGSLGSQTALFHQAYADDESNFGLQVADPDWILETALSADEANLQIAVHAIGDAANDQVLSIFETVKSRNGPRDRRLRIEHAQHLSAKAPKRFGSENIIASMQPDHLRDDALIAAKRIGEERAMQSSFLTKSLLSNGTVIALGSDWTVAPLEPLLGLQAATTRIPRGESRPWNSEELISIEAALKGYTWGSAYACFRDAQVGTLSPTKFADFVVLSDNLLTHHFSTTPSVLATYVAGERVYSVS